MRQGGASGKEQGWFGGWGRSEEEQLADEVLPYEHRVVLTWVQCGTDGVYGVWARIQCGTALAYGRVLCVVLPELMAYGREHSVVLT